MANFSDEEALDRVNHPRNSSSIELAKIQEERLLMHSEAIMEKFNLPFWAYRNFTLWWQSLITKEKYNKIDCLITTPLATISVVEEILKAVSKFNDAQDRYVAFEFATEDFTNDYEAYLTKINDDTFWKETCTEALMTGINDYVIVDLPANQTSERPEPFQYLVSPSMLQDVDINKFTGSVEYIAFKQNKFKWDSALVRSRVSMNLSSIQDGKDVQKMIFIDDTYYRVLAKEDTDSSVGSQWGILECIPHNLGYCPAIDFWKPSIQGTNGINKKGILTSLLSKLDKYLFYMALVDYMDIYGAFPIFVTYAMEDGEFDEKRKEVNFGDYYSPSSTSYVSGDKGTSQNPRVSYRWMGAPGSILEYPQPADGSDANFVKDSPHFINMPVEALKHVNDRCATLKCELIEYATGENKEFMNEISKNPDMFDASYSKQDSIITFVKRQVERVHRFVTKARAELRYGKEYFISCTVDYGTEFFLKNPAAIVKEYTEAVAAGMPPEYCEQIAKEASNTRFKNNIDILARQRIIGDVIPYQDTSMADMILAEVNKCDIDNFVIRINSGTFVKQFELEYGDIVKFGKNLNYSDKIFFIKNKLKEYGKGTGWSPAEQPTAGDSN